MEMVEEELSFLQGNSIFVPFQPVQAEIPIEANHPITSPPEQPNTTASQRREPVSEEINNENSRRMSNHDLASEIPIKVNPKPFDELLEREIQKFGEQEQNVKASVVKRPFLKKKSRDWTNKSSSGKKNKKKPSISPSPDSNSKSIKTKIEFSETPIENKPPAAPTLIMEKAKPTENIGANNAGVVDISTISENSEVNWAMKSTLEMKELQEFEALERDINTANLLFSFPVEESKDDGKFKIDIDREDFNDLIANNNPMKYSSKSYSDIIPDTNQEDSDNESESWGALESSQKIKNCQSFRAANPITPTKQQQYQINHINNISKDSQSPPPPPPLDDFNTSRAFAHNHNQSQQLPIPYHRQRQQQQQLQPPKQQPQQHQYHDHHHFDGPPPQSDLVKRMFSNNNVSSSNNNNNNNKGKGREEESVKNDESNLEYQQKLKELESKLALCEKERDKLKGMKREHLTKLAKAQSALRNEQEQFEKWSSDLKFNLEKEKEEHNIMMAKERKNIDRQSRRLQSSLAEGISLERKDKMEIESLKATIAKMKTEHQSKVMKIKAASQRKDTTIKQLQEKQQQLIEENQSIEQQRLADCENHKVLIKKFEKRNQHLEQVIDELEMKCNQVVLCNEDLTKQLQMFNNNPKDVQMSHSQQQLEQSQRIHEQQVENAERMKQQQLQQLQRIERQQQQQQQQQQERQLAESQRIKKQQQLEQHQRIKQQQQQQSIEESNCIKQQRAISSTQVNNENDQNAENEANARVKPDDAIQHDYSTLASATVVKERQLQDGKIEKLYSNGSKLIIFRNGTTKEIQSDKSIVRFNNGDVKQTDTKNNTVVYYYYSVDTTHTTYPDGVQVFEFPNNQVERHYPDGTNEIFYPDGTKKLIKAQ